MLPLSVFCIDRELDPGHLHPRFNIAFTKECEGDDCSESESDEANGHEYSNLVAHRSSPLSPRCRFISDRADGSRQFVRLLDLGPDFLSCLFSPLQQRI